MLALVNPWGTGVDISHSLRTYGDSPVHLWEIQHREKYDADPYPKKILISGVDDPALDRIRPVGFIPGFDFAVEISEKLSQRFGHPTNVPELMDARVSKMGMQQQLALKGIPSIGSIKVSSVPEAKRVADSVGTFPVVVKPTRGAAAANVAICHDGSAVLKACIDVLESRNFLKLPTVAVVQDFVEGTQYFVNTVSIGGEHVLCDVWEVAIDESGAVPLCVSASLVRTLSPELAAVVEYTRTCLDALGVREGAVHSEVRVTQSGPRLIEINARAMGGSLEPLPYRRATGHSHADLTAERYVDPELFRTRLDRPYRTHASVAMVFLYAPATGTIRSVDLSALTALPSFHSVRRLPQVGAQVVAREAAGGVANVGGTVLLGHEDSGVVERDCRAFIEDDIATAVLTIS